ncbi:MAG: CheB methylesterase domain-containing protein [Ignavibacteriota bacterium]
MKFPWTASCLLRRRCAANGRRSGVHHWCSSGISTGGPAALATVLPALPADLNAPVFIVQHMPAMFTKPLAASLSRRSVLRVKEAEDGEMAQANCVYLAPGGAQMKVVAGGARRNHPTDYRRPGGEWM